MKPHFMKLHFIFLLLGLCLGTRVYAQDYSVNTNCSTPFEDISGSSTVTTLGLLNDETQAVTLPFSFQFYDRTYSQIRISNDGGILFGNTIVTLTLPSLNTRLPVNMVGYNSYDVQAALFPYWDDLGANVGNVYTETKGTTPNRRFVVQWHNRNLINSSCLPVTNCGITFQVVLYERTNDFAFIYSDLIAGDTLHNKARQATIGIQKDKNSARQLSFNDTSYVAGRTCVTFTRLLTTESSMRYGVNSSTCAANPNYISFAGTNLNLDVNSRWVSQALTLPFNFTYYGKKFDKVHVTAYGVIWLNNANDTTIYGAERLDAYLTGMRPSIAGSGVFFADTYLNSVQVFVIEWRNMVPYGGVDGFNFQMQLFADGRIKYVYKDLYSGGPYDYGNNNTIALRSNNINQTVFSNERAIQIDGIANGTNCYCLDFFLPTVSYNNMPACLNTSVTNSSISIYTPNSSSTVYNYLSLINSNGSTVFGGSNSSNYTVSITTPESYRVEQYGYVNPTQYSSVLGYVATTVAGAQFNAETPTFTLNRMPRAQLDIFPRDTICSTEYAVLFSNLAGANSPAYQWNVGNQTTQGIQADSTFNYLVRITDRHNNCLDSIGTRIVKSPNSLISSVLFDRIAVGQLSVNLDTMLVSLTPDSLLYSTVVNYPRAYEGNNIISNRLFLPSQTSVGSHNVTVAVTDTTTGCVHSLVGAIQVIPDPIFVGLSPIYCGNTTTATIYRDSIAYPYLDTIISYFSTSQATPNNIKFIRLRRNRMTIAATNYSGVLPITLDANSFAFNPSLVNGASNITCTYETQIQVLNVANQVLINKKYISGESRFNVQVGRDTAVNIIDRTALYCEYNNFNRIRVTPAPDILSGTNAISIFTITNLSNGTTSSIIPNSLGEVYINPAMLDPIVDSNTNFSLVYSYTKLGCTRRDSINILIPEPINASFSSLPIATAYCSTSLPVQLNPVVSNTDPSVNQNNTFFTIDNISVPNRTFTPSVQLNPTIPVVGNHTIRYEIQDTFGCRSQTERVYTVNAIPTTSIVFDTTNTPIPLLYCVDTTPQMIRINLIPTTNGVGLLWQTTRARGRTSPNFNTATFPSFLANPDTMLGNQPITDILIYHYIFTDNNGCTDSVTKSIILNPAPVITFTDLPRVNCLDTSLSIPLNVFPQGTTRTFTGGTPNTNFPPSGTSFSPTEAVFNQVVRYDYKDLATGCVNRKFDTVDVVSDPTLFSFNQGIPIDVCNSASTPINLTVTRTGGTIPVSSSFSSNRSPNGLTSTGSTLSSTTDMATFIPSQSAVGTVVISYTAVLGTNGCSKTIQKIINVRQPTPINISFVGATNTICEYDQAVIFINNFPQALPSPAPAPRLDVIRGANSISSQGVIQQNSIRYDFIPNNISPPNRIGVHNIIANVTDSYGCPVTDTASIEVISNPIPFINGLSNSYCLSASLDTITGAPQNGNWYNITNGIKYGLQPYQPLMTSIADPAAIPMANINPLNFGTGGTFIFTPNTIDTTTFIYEVKYANGCINRDSQTVVVYPLPNLVIDPLPTLICSNNPNIPLRARVNGTRVNFPSVNFRELPTVAGGIVVDTSFSPGALIPGPISDIANRTIIATYTFPNSGCTDTDTLNVQVRRPPSANIVGLSPASCVNTLPNTITGENLDMVAMAAGIFSATFSSRDAGVITQLSSTSATFTPSLITNGSDTVTYTVVAPNGCSDSEVRIIVSNNLPTGLSTTMSNTVYCENGTVVPIAGLPIPNSPAVGSFSVIDSTSTRVDTSNNNTLNLMPQTYANNSGVGTYALVYRYQDVNGCVNFDTTRFTIHPRPSASFTQNTFCIGDTIQLRDNSTFASTINNADTLRFWNWAYQGQAYSNNTANFLNLFNLPAGTATAQLVATSGAGCKGTTTQTVRVFNNPRVRFSTTGGCTGATVNFRPDSTFLVSTIDTISGALWNFGDGTTVPATISNNTLILPTNHVYATAGVYFPSLFIANQGYCIGSDTLRIAISPKVDPSILPYVEDFEQTDGAWIQSLPNNQAIWKWGVANKTQLTDTATGNKVWITGLRTTGPNGNIGAHPQNADTWIYGPCFDFTNSVKPMVKLDIAADMYAYDGVALEYFNNSTGRWTTIGQNTHGVNWYNNPSALGLYDYDPTQPYNPNWSSLHAWSGAIGFIGSNNATTMQTSRYRLDALKGQDNVQIRISFGGLNTPNLAGKEGFMFDNVWVGERRRNVLVEHFASQNHTNMGVSTYHLNNLIFNQQNVHDIVLIEYHTELQPDALFFDSQAGNSARRLYYGANNAEVAVDGNAWLGATLALNAQQLDNEMLQDPEFSINRLNLSINQQTNTATIRAEVRAEKNLPASMQYQIYPCFVEDSLSWLTQLGFVNQMGVFRQFAPSASGLNHSRSWQIGDTIYVEQSWTIDISTLNINRLEGIVFIQDSTKKVLQAAQTRNLNVLTLPQYPVSIEHLEQAQAQGREIFDLNLYPNPAVDFTTLAFDAPLTQDYQFEVYDVQGRLLQRGKLNEGSQQQQIDVTDYAAGMYVVAIFDQQRTVLTRRKFVVSRP
jgi:hypothetical protein